MGTYIKGMGCISPQKTFDGGIFTEGTSSWEGNRLRVVEPPYADFLDPKQLRRMSKVIRTGVVAAMLATRESKTPAISGVIAATSLGCIEDTDIFMKKLIGNKEELLNPSAFIHSTHNTVAGQIALIFQCKGYNSTYSHKSQSFESTLLDAIMLLEETPRQDLLAGGIDELTDTSFLILERLGHFKNAEQLNSGNLYATPGKGSAGGEGSAFFVLSGEKDHNCFAELIGVHSWNFTDAATAAGKMQQWLREHNIQPDLLITGRNGDSTNDADCDTTASHLGMENRQMGYKHLCGEYGTASAFASWMAAGIIRKGQADPVFSEKMAGMPVSTVLIYNRNHGHHNFILLGAC
jgi:3-oxoacyl-[acyl-carrier-protein] synthase II